MQSFRIGKHDDWRYSAPTELVAVGKSSETDHGKNNKVIVQILNGLDLPMAKTNTAHIGRQGGDPDHRFAHIQEKTNAKSRSNHGRWW